MIKNWIVCIIALLVVSGCTGEACIEADNFGHSQVVVSARYDKKDLKDQVRGQQIAPWVDSHYYLNGKPLMLSVKHWDEKIDYNLPSDLSAWCAWYGSGRHDATLSRICERLPECKFIDDTMCTDSIDAKISNAPCIFKDGVGLYALMAKKGTDPNATLASKESPLGINFHVGEPQEYKIYDVNRKGESIEVGGRVYNYASEKEKNDYAGSKLYFKIFDYDYNDNSGQYRVLVKSGITKDKADPISYGIKLVKDFLYNDNYGVIRNIYQKVVNQPGYQLAVKGMLSLYIMFTALSYFAGNIQITHTELIVRVVKIAIVSALLSTEYSWSFFNDYLFAYFIGGMDQILTMITEAGASGPGSSGILGMMIAPQTTAKVLSLLFVDQMGFIYIILFIIALLFVVLVFFKAAVIYLTALIMVGVIITVGPIFVCFMLFGVTKSLFENWLKQLISYSVQPIILFTGLMFISMILSHEIYGSLGFKVCKHTFPKLTKSGEAFVAGFTADVVNDGAADSIFYWWFPDPMKGDKFTTVPVPIPVPIDHFVSDDAYDNSNNIINTLPGTNFCEAYACIEERLVDLPFLDPEKDKRRINHFHNGKFVQLDGMLLIFAAIYLLYKFNEISVQVSRFLTGTSSNYTNIGKVGNIAQKDLISVAPIAARFAKKGGGMAFRAVRSMHNRVAGAHMAVGEMIVGGGSRERGKKRIGAAAKAVSTGVDYGLGMGNKAKGQENRAWINKNVNTAKSAAKVAAAATVAAPAYAVKMVASVAGSASRSIGQLKINKLKRAALSKHADKSILKEIATKYGLSQKDLQKDASGKYRAALADKLQQLDKGLKRSDAEKLAKQMSKKRPGAVMDEFASAKYDKKFSDLSKDEKAFIETLNDKELRQMSKESDKERQFQKAYVDTHIELSNQGALKTNRNSLLNTQAYAVFEDVLRNTPLGDGVPNGIVDSKENHRKETQLEKSKSERANLERFEVEKRIVELNNKFKEPITSPEFVVKDRIRIKQEWGQGLKDEGKREIQAVSGYIGKLAYKGYEKALPKQARSDLEKTGKYLYRQSEKSGSELYSQLSGRAELVLGSKATHMGTEQLAQAELRNEVRSRLENGDEPVIMGNTYISKVATDEEMVKMIEGARSVEKEMIQELADQNQALQNKYEALEKDSEVRLQSFYNDARLMLEKVPNIDMDQVPVEKIPELLRDAFADKSVTGRLGVTTDHGRKWNSGMAKETAQQLEQAIGDFTLSQEVFKEVDSRKMEVSKEIDKRVDEINSHREKRGMEVHQTEKEAIKARPMRKIDDFLVRKK